MGNKYLISVGVETYSESKISKVDFAENDATGIAKVLGLHDFKMDSKDLLLSSKATKTTIESRLRLMAKKMTIDDTLYLFYAGHGFSKNGENYLTCYDTARSDIVNTSIKLQAIFDELKKSKCQRIVMFLDACETGMEFDSTMRSIYSELNDSELAEFFSEAQFQVCFSACKTGEHSYPSSNISHGIWTYHLIRALEGKAKLAIQAAGIVSSASLQNYLKIEVPKFISINRTDGAIQTPWTYGTASQEFQVVDVGPLLKKQAESKKIDNTLKNFLFSITKFGAKVASLELFRKGAHRIPSGVNEATTRFLGTLVEDEIIRKDIDSTLVEMRAELGYKRNEMVFDVNGTGGTIRTPDFIYEITASLDEASPSLFDLRRELKNINNKEIIETAGFKKIFGSFFSSIEFHFSKDIDVEKLIDVLEDLDYQLNYDSNCQYCEFSLPEVEGSILVTPRSLVISNTRPSDTQKMLENFAGFRRALSKDKNLSKFLK